MKLPLFYQEASYPGIGVGTNVPASIERIGAEVERIGQIGTHYLGFVQNQMARRQELDFTNAVNGMAADYSLGSQQVMADARANWKDEKTYRADLEKGLTNLKQVLAGKYGPDVARFANDDMTRTDAGHFGANEEWVKARWSNDKLGQLQTSLENETQIAADHADSGGIGAFQDSITRVRSMLASYQAEGVIKDAAKIYDDWHSNLDTERLNRDILKDQVGPLSDYPGLSAEKYLGVLRSYEDHNLMEAERSDKETQESLKKSQEAMETDFVSQISQGQDVSQTLSAAIGARRLTSDQIKGIYSFQKSMAEQKTDASQDEALALRVEMDVRGSTPTVTERQLKGWMQQNADSPGTGINPKTGIPLLEHIVASRKSLVDEGKAKLSARQTEAHRRLEDAIRAGKGPLESLSQEQARAIVVASKELDDRSAFMNGTEDPLKIVDDMIPRYSKIAAKDLQLSNEKTKRLLKYPTPSKLMEARKKGQISEADYQYQLSLFQTLRESGMAIDYYQGEQKPFKFNIPTEQESAGRKMQQENLKKEQNQRGYVR